VLLFWIFFPIVFHVVREIRQHTVSVELVTLFGSGELDRHSWQHAFCLRLLRCANTRIRTIRILMLGIRWDVARSIHKKNRNGCERGVQNGTVVATLVPLLAHIPWCSY
jgi:hypothetical protein